MNAKLSEREVLNEGFRPLTRAPTEPVLMTSPKPNCRNKNMSFNAKTGEQESIQPMWENSTFNRMERSKGKVRERSLSFIGKEAERAGPDVPEREEAIVVVDPFSTGAHLAKQCYEAGFKVVQMLSIWNSPVASLIEQGLVVEYSATLQFNDLNPNVDDALRSSVAEIKNLPFPVIAVIPGAETGVELADKLSDRLNLRSNGSTGTEARRNKYLMGEKVRKAGVRAVQQRLCRTVSEIEEFLLGLPGGKPGSVEPLKCVVKPVQSAGSDDVYLCNCKEEALTAFEKINGKRNGLGLINDGALVQEFLSGKEYVIDKVSKDGVHKLVAIWQYDKRPINGASFVYFGMKLMDCKSPMFQRMVRYSSQVLDALEIRQGPSHMEVMWSGDEHSGSPCLVEVGSRCHGGEGTWIHVAQECIGFTQVSVTTDVYTNGPLFATLKENEYTLKKAGRDVDMVSRHSGVVRGFPGESKIRALPSFRSLKWECKKGDFIPKTVDCFTRPGCVQLVAPTEQEADEDLERVHDLEELSMIDYSIICPKQPVIGAIAIVDPFSSGANLAAMAAKWGYRVILVFSEMDSPVAKMVSQEAGVESILLIQHDGRMPDQDRAMKDTLDAIENQEGYDCKSPVLAIIPGAETGVELAEQLAFKFGTRSNGLKQIRNRRSKFGMQNRLRETNVRSVVQRLCRSEDEAKTFFLEVLGGMGVKKCVVKPNESAGSDSVYLCSSLEEVLVAFDRIHGKFNGLGQVNDGALIQEFLSGTEYAIDGVSRDGIYKVTAIWEYDKRHVNGSDFVYFGMRLRSGVGDKAQALIKYAQQVMDSLHIVQGPSHMEVILTPHAGPCLVEVGCRCHGGEASWLPIAEECLGYSQLESTLNCYLRPDRFDALPSFPTLLNKQGAEVFLVSRQGGIVEGSPGVEEIRRLPSFRRLEIFTQVGARVVPTVDCFTRPGSVQLVSDAPGQLEEDYDHIRSMEEGRRIFKLKK